MTPRRRSNGAFAAGGASTGAVTVESSTVLGTVRVTRWRSPTRSCSATSRVANRQAGCARFSYLTADSRSPRRYYCAPTAAGEVPHFTSLRFASPAYARLNAAAPLSIRRGAEDESEMGAHHRLQERQRAADLITRLDEYLPLGLRAGLIYET